MWAASSVLYSRTLVGLDLLPRALLGLDFLPRNEHTLDRRACDWPDPSSLGWPNLASAGQSWPTLALASLAGQRFQRQSFSQWNFSESFRIGLFSQPVHQLVGQAVASPWPPGCFFQNPFPFSFSFSRSLKQSEPPQAWHAANNRQAFKTNT